MTALPWLCHCHCSAFSIVCLYICNALVGPALQKKEHWHCVHRNHFKRIIVVHIVESILCVCVWTTMPSFKSLVFYDTICWINLLSWIYVERKGYNWPLLELICPVNSVIVQDTWHGRGRGPGPTVRVQFWFVFPPQKEMNKWCRFFFNLDIDNVTVFFVGNCEMWYFHLDDYVEIIWKQMKLPVRWWRINVNRDCEIRYDISR